MVEKMNVIHLLMAASDAESVLADLQDLGVVHIETSSVGDDSGVMEMGARIVSLKKTLADLDKFAPEDKAVDKSDNKSGDAETSAQDCGSIQRVCGEALGEISSLTADSDRMRKELAQLKPWGGFKRSDLTLLENEGVLITFHVLSSKAFEAAEFGDRHIEVINEGKSGVYFVEIRRETADAPAAPPLFPEERLSRAGTEEILRQIQDAEDKVAALEGRMRNLYSSRNVIEQEVIRLETERERRIAGLSLNEEADGEVVRLKGYIPLSLVPSLESFIESRSIVPLMDRSAGTADTPIKLKNGPVARLFEPITKIFGLPQYVEIDTTPFFAPFFAFFFGFCLADVGYGIIVTLSALAGFLLLKKKALKSLAALGFILGLMTVLGGLFLNTLFGMKIDGIPNLPDGVGSFLLFRDINDAMTFSILLGVVQILLGFVMQVVNKWRSNGFAASLQPAGTFILIVGVTIWAVGNMGASFLIGPIPVGAMIVSLGNTRLIGLGLAAFGVLLILFFNNPGKKIWIRPLLGLWEMYGIASGVPGDILSYIRLFALSLAGGLLGGAINLIAVMIRGDSPNIFSWIFMLLVLIGGHFINFALAALGAFVHPLRLTFVEFYKSVGFTGGGKPYKPYGGKIS